MTESKEKRASFALLGGVALFALLCCTRAQAAEVMGFQNAHFGADEKEVIAAATKDLSIKAGDIEIKKDDQTKVTILSAKIKDYAPLNMAATINYVLGYKCNCLTRVVVQWDFPEPTSTEQRKSAMLAVGALIGKLNEKGWGKEEVVMNRMLGDVKEGSEGAVVFFRGQDKQNQAITLAGAPVKMEKNAKASKAGPKTDALAANIDKIKTVSLIYEKDAVNPDIYRVDVSNF